MVLLLFNTVIVNIAYTPTVMLIDGIKTSQLRPLAADLEPKRAGGVNADLMLNNRISRTKRLHNLVNVVTGKEIMSIVPHEDNDKYTHKAITADGQEYFLKVTTKIFPITISEDPVVVSQEEWIYDIVELAGITHIINPEGRIIELDGKVLEFDNLPQVRTTGDAEGTLARRNLYSLAQKIGVIDKIGEGAQASGLLAELNGMGLLTEQKRVALERLRDSVLHDGRIPSPREILDVPPAKIEYEDFWVEHVGRFFGHPWVNTELPVMVGTYYLEYLKMVAAGYFTSLPDERIDPFSRIKQRALSKELLVGFNKKMTSLYTSGKTSIKDIAESLLGITIGNSFDLSQPHDVHPPEAILVDDSLETAQFLLSDTSEKPVGLFADNAGEELLNVILFSVLLLKEKIDQPALSPGIKLYIKPYPVAITDVTRTDITATIKILQNSKFDKLRDLANDFSTLISTGQIELVLDDIFTIGARHLDAMEKDWADNRANIFVGDAYYRLIIGDRKCGFEYSIASVIPSWFHNIIILRATKHEECMVGTDPNILVRALSIEPNHYFTGRAGLVQYIKRGLFVIKTDYLERPLIYQSKGKGKLSQDLPIRPIEDSLRALIAIDTSA
jgi:hypothetical protein